MLKPIVRSLRVGQFAIAVSIFTYFALVPSSALNTSQSDITLHFAGNFLLFLSAWLACYGRLNSWRLLLLLVPYSLLIELAQWLAPTRFVDSRDMLANMAGLATGLTVAFFLDKALMRLPRLRSYLTKH